VEIATSAGDAQVVLDEPENPAFLLLLTHGAAGGVDTADLLAAGRAGLDRGAVVARVMQPYRVRGARAPGSPGRQDGAWLEIVAALRRRFPDLPLIQGGRSNGARVACRTARAAGAHGVIALAFPLHPPGHPEVSRASELAGAGTRVLVINGDRDPFGVPAKTRMARVAVLPGETHALSRHPEQIRRIVAAWLAALPAIRA
jgi:predicted alpha/beta-hydrolase family hydrolase